MENVLTANIIVSSVGGQASTRMQPTEPTDIAAKWGIGLEPVRPTLDCTTQRGHRTVIHLSLRQLLRANDQQLRYRHLQHDVFGENLLARTKSKRRNKYFEVFVTKFGWSRAFPMAKNGDSYEALSQLFQQDGVLPKMIVDGSKDQTMIFFNVRLQSLDVT